MTPDQKEHWVYQIETARLMVQQYIPFAPVEVEAATLLAADADLTTLTRERDEARDKLAVEQELAKQRWLDLAAAESEIDRLRRQIREWSECGASRADMAAFLAEG